MTLGPIPWEPWFPADPEVSELHGLYELAVENARLRAQLKELRKVLNTEDV